MEEGEIPEKRARTDDEHVDDYVNTIHFLTSKYCASLPDEITAYLTAPRQLMPERITLRLFRDIICGWPPGEDSVALFKHWLGIRGEGFDQAQWTHALEEDKGPWKRHYGLFYTLMYVYARHPKPWMCGVLLRAIKLNEDLDEFLEPRDGSTRNILRAFIHAIFTDKPELMPLLFFMIDRLGLYLQVEDVDSGMRNKTVFLLAMQPGPSVNPVPLIRTLARLTDFSPPGSSEIFRALGHMAAMLCTAEHVNGLLLVMHNSLAKHASAYDYILCIERHPDQLDDFTIEQTPLFRGVEEDGYSLIADALDAKLTGTRRYTWLRTSVKNPPPKARMTLEARRAELEKCA